MTIAKIFAGESKGVGFKEDLPEKGIKYIKFVVVFANGTGGEIIFGVADKTRGVVGFGKEDVFKKIDAITSAVSSSCESAIIPDATAQTVDGKTIIVLEVSGGRQYPYYIKAPGRKNGVYTKVAGTTRPADEYMMKELLFKGSNRHFGQGSCTGLPITDEEIEGLCKAMKTQAIKNVHNDEQKESIKDVYRRQLRSWGILIEWDGEDCPTNAFAVLIECGELRVATQCSVLKGTTKKIFADRRKYDGPPWKQIKETYQFVLRNTHLGITFEGVYRQDIYEIPSDAICELIINVIVHRNYLDHGTMQAVVYDDRLKITSPGKLSMDQTIECMKEEYSKIRNEALTYAFSYINLTEHQGSGIPKIIDGIEATELRASEFVGGDVGSYIDIYRNRSAANNTTNDTNINASGANGGANVLAIKEQGQMKDLLDAIEQNPSTTQAYYVEQAGASKRAISRTFISLQEKGTLIQNGTK